MILFVSLPGPGTAQLNSRTYGPTLRLVSKRVAISPWICRSHKYLAIVMQANGFHAAKGKFPRSANGHFIAFADQALADITGHSAFQLHATRVLALPAGRFDGLLKVHFEIDNIT